MEMTMKQVLEQLSSVIKALADTNTPETLQEIPALTKQLLQATEQHIEQQIATQCTQDFINVQKQCSEIVQNASNGNIKYATLEQYTKAVRKIFADNNFCLIFKITDKSNLCASTPYIMITAKAIHVTGRALKASAMFPIDVQEKRTAMQNMGATITYARRYLIGMLLNITTTQDDNDGAAIPVSAQKLNEIRRLIKSTGTDMQKVLQFAGVKDINEVSWEKASIITHHLQKRLRSN